jgi:hypothetical protein
MTRPTLLASLFLLCAAPAGAGLPEFKAALPAFQPFLPGGAAKGKPKPAPKRIQSVTDSDTWAKMIESALRNPTSTQDLRVAGVDYKVSAVVSESVVPGQECASGFKPRNALYVAQAAGGPGGAVYPVRMVSDCVGPALTKELFALDADAAGLIQDSAFYDPMTDQSVDPSQDHMSPAQAARFDAYMAAMVRLFADGR